MFTKGFIAKLVMVAGLGVFAAFAWLSLPSPPRPAAERAGHAHGGDPAALADGVVLSVERAAGRITISHGPLYHLGMPPMSMPFRVEDHSLLDRVKEGDKVKFHADVAGGELTLTRIERVP